ncbi:MAG: ACP S-malonyltransferase [Dehalococcoidia bacterium]|nr:ACP S-malonyltransferase [Dehalococcoidia bacterium]
MGNIALLFPGQGSQAVGMGRTLFESSAEARAIFEEADSTLGWKLSRLCFEGPEDELRQTVNAQPAIMTVSVACMRSAQGEGLVDMSKPLFVAGHSLGEYTALVAAGALTFAEAVRLVRERGRLMQYASTVRPGGMAAVLGLDEVALEEVCQQADAQIANINSPEQIVISGSREGIARAMDMAKARGARRVIPLEVSGAFHSLLMWPAAQGIAKAVAELRFAPAAVPVVANCTGHPITTVNEIKAELVKQMCNAVHWARSMEYMLSAGADTFVEIGPGRVLSGLAKRFSKDITTINIDGSPAGVGSRA